MTSYCSYRTIKIPNDYRIIIQEDLNTLTKWAGDCMMEFNTPKCKIIQITIHYMQQKYFYIQVQVSARYH